jgi:hypothetical protein
MDGFSGTTQAPENGYEIWHVECHEPVYGRLIIQLAQDRDRWRVLVNTVMDLRVLAPRS